MFYLVKNKNRRLFKMARILLVDDEPMVRELFKDVLVNEDHAVMVVDSAEKALNVFQEDIACLVTDFRMPGMDGIDLIFALREKNPNLPVVLVSGTLDNARKKLGKSFEDCNIQTFAKGSHGIDVFLEAVQEALA